MLLYGFVKYLFLVKVLKRMRMMIILMISFLLTIYIAYFLNFNYVNEPDPSTFKESVWMKFIPSQILGFRYINFTQLSSFKNLFSSDVVFSFSGLNVSVYDIDYGIDMLTRDNELIYVVSLKQNALNDIASLLENQSSVVHKDLKIYPLYEKELGENIWACFYNGALILSNGINAIKKIIEAEDLLFSYREIKIGYLLASLGEDQMSFYYVVSGDNSYGVDWEMRSAKSGITVRYLLYFPSNSDLNSWYSEIAKTIFSNSRRIYRSNNFVFGDFSYPPNEIRAVLMGL